MPIENITVILNKQEFSQWESVSIEMSYEDAAMSFELSVSEANWAAEDMFPFIYQELAIYASPDPNKLGDLMVTGYIDVYEGAASGDAHEVKISGRSKGADAVKSHVLHKTGRIEKKTLVDAANEFAKHTGVSVKFTSDLSLPPIPKIQLARHDTLFAVVEREARKQGAILAGQPDGTVKITRPDGERHSGQLVEGYYPLKDARVRLDVSGQHSPIVVRAQRAFGTDAKSLRLEHVDVDATVKRVAPKVIHLEGDGDKKKCQNRAAWEKMRQAAKARQWMPRVCSWRDSTGKIWKPGRLIACTAPRWHIKGDLLLKSASFSQDLESGTIAALTLVDPRSLGGKAPAGKSGASWSADGGAGALKD